MTCRLDRLRCSVVAQAMRHAPVLLLIHEQIARAVPGTCGLPEFAGSKNTLQAGKSMKGSPPTSGGEDRERQPSKVAVLATLHHAHLCTIACSSAWKIAAEDTTYQKNIPQLRLVACYRVISCPQACCQCANTEPARSLQLLWRFVQCLCVLAVQTLSKRKRKAPTVLAAGGKLCTGMLTHDMHQVVDLVQFCPVPSCRRCQGASERRPWH